MEKFLSAAISIYFAGIVSAFAYGQATSLNLGSTSFLDGMGNPTGHGLIFEQYDQFSRFNAFTGPHGDNLPLPGPELDTFVSVNQLIYGPDVHILGWQPAMTVLVPFVSLNATYAEPGPFPQDSGGGLGDVIFGPILQGSPVIRNGRPVFSQRVEFDVIAPTGGYNDHKAINPSSGFWSINPYWAMTYMPTPKLALSTRVQYLYNWSTNDPAAPQPGERTFQAGQAILDNFDTSYEVAANVRLGINGYFMRQITDNKINGQNQHGSREEVLGIGPGALITSGKQNAYFINVYFDAIAENRVKGDTIQFRYVHFFNIL